MSNLLFILAGLALLILGSEALLRGSLGAARSFGVSPLLSGLIIVGLGTSTPELFVSARATLNAESDIAIGNIIGSNIANILLVLAICAMTTPMALKPSVLRTGALVAAGASVLFILLSRDGLLGRIDAVTLLICLTIYLFLTHRHETYHDPATAEAHHAAGDELRIVPASRQFIALIIIVGLLFLFGGSLIFIEGMIGIAQSLNVSKTAIGLTAIAVSTSLPELSFAMVATLRKHADVAVSSIVGSNIFNLLGILGISALLQPLTVDARILNFDQWVMFGSASLLLVFLYTGGRLGRFESSVQLLIYICYAALTFAALRS